MTLTSTARAFASRPALAPTLAAGHRGQDVRKLQEQLRNLGFNLQVDGVFGPKTAEAVRAFQKAHQLPKDGIVGAQTHGFLATSALPSNGLVKRAPVVGAKRPEGTVRLADITPRPVRTTSNNPVSLASPESTEQQKFEHYEAILRAHGGQVKTSGERSVLGLRGLSIDGKNHATTSNDTMNDTVVVLWKDQNGRGHVRELAASTHSRSARSSGKGKDADKDGVLDVGMMLPGTYRATPNGTKFGGPSYWLTQQGSGALPAVRDTNHDGQFSAEEYRQSSARGDKITEVLFHPGKNGKVNSAGCQNVLDYTAFVEALGGSRAAYDYTLVDASR